MEQPEYLRNLRELIHDPEGKVWNDGELVEMLDYAARTYSTDTGFFRGTFRPLVDAAGVCQAPRDHVAIVMGWNELGEPVEAGSTDNLARCYGDYPAIEGLPRFICEELDTIGELRFCPNPYKLQNQEFAYPESPYGLAPKRTYGVPTDAEEYGIPVSFCRYHSTGDEQYIRTGTKEEIFDYTAVIWHAAYQAYNMDSDFQNTARAEMFLTQYRQRVRRAIAVGNNHPRIDRGGRFF